MPGDNNILKSKTVFLFSITIKISENVICNGMKSSFKKDLFSIMLKKLS